MHKPCVAFFLSFNVCKCEIVIRAHNVRCYLYTFNFALILLHHQLLLTMGKKKQEMSQVYANSNNEFIFGENGGRGKHLSSFLKNLSLTGSSRQTSGSSLTGPGAESDADISSSIYGNLGYSADLSGATGGRASPSRDRKTSYSPTRSFRSVSGPVGAGYSHAESTERAGGGSPFSSNDRRSASHSRRSMKYTDLDDDWDAELDGLNEREKPQKTTPKLQLAPSLPPMVDSLYPDLTMAFSPQQQLSKESSIEPNNTTISNTSGVTTNKSDNFNSYNTSTVSSSKHLKFKKIMEPSSINIQDLRKLSWNGIPSELRAITWQILLGYLPTNKSRQESTLNRKRQEYLDGVDNIREIDFNETSSGGSNTPSTSNSSSQQLYHQINIDVKRTHPKIKLYSYAATQKSLRRILYLWSIRHPASGYVQGINDLCTPFYQIFLGHYLWQVQRAKISSASDVKRKEEEQNNSHLLVPGLFGDPLDSFEKDLLQLNDILQLDVMLFDPGRLSARVCNAIEADTYWCLSRLLENITDNYIHQQPGIIRQVNELNTLIAKIDVELLAHFQSEGIEFMQFSFRWMNCLLMRELSMPLITRMWDTYLSESPLGFNDFHVYVCAAFLIKFSDELKHKDFQEILLFLQNPPTQLWLESDVELMLSEAFIWQSLYKNATAHLR